MQSSHAASAVSARFDDRNLVADAGLPPAVRLAERGRLSALVHESVGIRGADNSGGANPVAKVTSLVAAMCAGADSISRRRRPGAALAGATAAALPVARPG
ncbi:hypothetical protein GCM10017744_104810 [Streptomyces antimycoticus]|uniref:Transposase DDE domain-containing protein n=1 Tax=Streptomyces antimycoticus TaxID=68175 RepID=A0A4D4KQL8_9ACTN|nr:hypothetical protein SANT12839_100880 [Streptomyces antimycoticus]